MAKKKVLANLSRERSFSEWDEKAFDTLLRGLPRDEKRTLCTLGIIKGGITERSFRRIFQFRDISWLVIKNTMIKESWLQEREVIVGHNLLELDRRFCELASTYLTDQARKTAEDRYRTYYCELAKVTFENRHLLTMREWAILELHNLADVLEYLLFSEEIHRAKELKKHVSHLASHSPYMYRLIYPKPATHYQENQAYSGSRTGVFYDDESFIVLFKGTVIGIVLHAKDGWNLIAQQVSRAIG